MFWAKPIMRVTVQEASSYSAGVFLWVIEALSIVSFAAKRHSGVADWIILAVVCGWMTFFGGLWFYRLDVHRFTR